MGVVVPAHNAGRFLAETLESVRAQTLTDWRCVVVDDGSTDDTLAIAEGFAARDPRFRAIRQVNGGPGAARNHGTLELGPDVGHMSFMDADDVWAPHALETLKSAIDETPGAIGAHGLADWIDERGSPISPGTFTSIGRGRLGCSGGKHYPWPPDQPTNFEVLVTHNVLFPPGLLLAEASAFRAAGLFTTQRHLQGVADWEMFQRLARFGDLQLVDEVILGYRMHDTNISGSSTMAAQMTSVRRSCFYSPENTAEQERLVRDAWRSQQRGDASQRWREGRRHLKSREFRSAVVSVSRLPLVGGRYLWGRPRKRLTRTERRAGFPSAG